MNEPVKKRYRVKVEREPLLIDLEAYSDAEAIEEVLRKRPHYEGKILSVKGLEKNDVLTIGQKDDT